MNSPIFIGGCGHSGTSFLRSILGAHSNIYAVPYESRFAFKPKEEWKASSDEFELLRKQSGKKRWLEKTAQHVLAMGDVMKAFPDSPFILVIRDGRDVACSIRDRWGIFGHGVRRWMSDNKAGEMHWANPRVLVLRYERIIENFEEAIGGVMKFLGESYEPGMKNYQETLPKIEVGDVGPISPKEHDKYRAWQVRQPLFDGRGRWKKDMTLEEKGFFKELAGKMLIQYGYAQDEAW